MSKKSCQNCLFTEQCPSHQPCRHYSPVVDDDDGDDLIERGRKQFAREWGSYLKESQDSDF